MPSFVNYKKESTLLPAASDKVYQLLAHGRWFSQSTPASSITKTGRHDIAEILLKVALSTINQSINHSYIFNKLLTFHRELYIYLYDQFNSRQHGIPCFSYLNFSIVSRKHNKTSNFDLLIIYIPPFHRTILSMGKSNSCQ